MRSESFRKLLAEGTLENPAKSGAEGARLTAAESLRQKDRAKKQKIISPELLV